MPLSILLLPGPPASPASWRSPASSPSPRRARARRALPRPLASALALLATGLALGVLAPLYGRVASVGLWAARAGVALGAFAVLLPDGDATVAARVAASLLVVVGLRPVVRRAGGLTDLPSWTVTAVGADVAALLLPTLGGGLVLASRVARRRRRHPGDVGRALRRGGRLGVGLYERRVPAIRLSADRGRSRPRFARTRGTRTCRP